MGKGKGGVGYVFEAMICDVLTAAQRQRVESYLGRKYGIAIT